MMTMPHNVVADRRAHIRITPPGLMRIDHKVPGNAIANASVLNISKGGAALLSDQPVEVGEHLIFTTQEGLAPVHCQVLQCQPSDDGWFRIRCRCIMGGFDISELQAIDNQ